MPQDENIIRLADALAKAEETTTPEGYIPVITGDSEPHNLKKIDASFIDEIKNDVENLESEVDNKANQTDLESLSDDLHNNYYTKSDIDSDYVTQSDFDEVMDVVAGNLSELEETKADKVKVVEIDSSDSAEIELENNTIYNITYSPVGEIVLPDSLSDVSNLDYISQLNFSVFDGETCTVTPPSISGFEMRWVGDDVEDNEFIPVENSRYSIMFNYDGIFIRAIVQSVKIDLLGD